MHEWYVREIERRCSETRIPPDAPPYFSYASHFGGMSLVTPFPAGIVFPEYVHEPDDRSREPLPKSA